MDTPRWFSASECKTNDEAVARIEHLIRMGADPDWPRQWFRKLSYIVSPIRQPLAIELLVTADEEMDYPEHFIPMRERFVRWLDSEIQTVSPLTSEDWQLLRTYQEQMEGRINSVLDSNDEIFCI